MKITFLGTGTSQGIPVIACDCETCSSPDPKDKRLRCSIMIETEGKVIVIDTGPDFREQMLREGVQRVDAVLMTHEHKDHIAGLDDVRPFNFKYKKDMPVYASARVQEALKREYQYIFTPPFYPGIPKIDLHTISKDQPFVVAGIEVQPIEVMHHLLPVLGFRMGDFTYITDAKTIAPAEKEKIRGTKVLVLNALRRGKHPSHLTLEEALEWVEDLQPEQAWFTHISHKLERHELVERDLPEHVRLAYDGLELVF